MWEFVNFFVFHHCKLNYLWLGSDCRNFRFVSHIFTTDCPVICNCLDPICVTRHHQLICMSCCGNDRGVFYRGNLVWTVHAKPDWEVSVEIWSDWNHISNYLKCTVDQIWKNSISCHFIPFQISLVAALLLFDFKGTFLKKHLDSLYFDNMATGNEMFNSVHQIIAVMTYNMLFSGLIKSLNSSHFQTILGRPV